MQKVKIGIIGLGEIAQIIHLPILEVMENQFEIAAICDVSEKLVQTIGDKYNVKSRYYDYNKMIEEADIDAVIVLTGNHYHADCTVKALEKNIYVLLEKPMCFTISDADKIIEANGKSSAETMIAYMRCFSSAFEMAIKEVGGIDKITYVNVRDIIGPNEYFIGQASAKVYKYDDIPKKAIDDNKLRFKNMLEEVFDNKKKPDILINSYDLLNGLNSHDISALRELVGKPQKVVSAVAWNNGSNMSAIFKYDNFYASFETAYMSSYGKFDASIGIYSNGKNVIIQYDTPYIIGLPVKLIVQETTGSEYVEKVIRPTFNSPFEEELEYFHSVVTKGIKPKSTPEAAKEDLLLFQEAIKIIESNL